MEGELKDGIGSGGSTERDASTGLSVVIPAYNEEEGIARVVAEIREMLSKADIPSEIIVVNDASTDGTGEILESTEGIRVFSHRQNMGYGAAIKTGMRAARFGWVCITDGDGTYPNEKIPELMSWMGENDMAVGARMGKRIPLIRRPAKWILNQLANYLAQQKIPDLNSGLRIFRKEVAEHYLGILPDRFSFTTTITLAMVCNHHKVKFIPITYHQRKGKSKIRPFHDTMNFLQLIVRTILYFDPLRIFLPMGTGLLLTATILFVLRQIQGGGYGITIPMFLLAGIQVLAIGMLADLIDRRMKS